MIVGVTIWRIAISVFCILGASYWFELDNRLQRLEMKQIEDEPQTDCVLSKDSDAYKFNKRMEVEEMWLNEQSGKE